MERSKTGRFSTKRKSFLLTLVVSIILLICIPLISFQLWVVQQSVEEIKTNYTESYIAALQSNAQSFNTQISLLDKTAVKISDDLLVNKLLQENASGYDIFLAAQAIKDYSVGLPSVECTCVYYPSRNAVLTEGYWRAMELFYDIAGAADESQQQELVRFLDDLKKMETLLLIGPGGNKLLIAQPIRLASQSSFDNAVIYIINLDDLMATFQVNLPSGASMAIVSPETEWLLYDTQFPVAECENDIFKQFLMDSRQHFCELTTQQGFVEIYKYMDYSTGNCYLSAMIKEDAQRQLTVYVDRVRDIMTMSLLLFAVFFIIVVYINYKPIRKLVQRHSVMMGKSDLSDLELLDSAFFARDEQISNQRSLLVGFILGDLLYGTQVNGELLEKQFGQSHLRYFSVVTVTSVEMTTSQSNEVADELWKNLENTEVYTTGVPNRTHVLFVLMSEYPIDEVLVKADVVMAIRTVLGCNGEVRVGKVVQKLEDIRESYYSSLMEESRDMKVNEIATVGAYPAEEVQYFIQRVCMGDEGEALKSLEKIEIIFTMRKYRPTYQQYYCYKLLTSVLTGLRENQITISEEQMDVLMAFRNQPKLFALLRELVSYCCNQVECGEENVNAQLQKKLLEYVEANLYNSELCLTSAADYLNVSTYAVSRLFKESTGTGFKEYVTAKRLDQAYKLLKTTADSVGDVARAVGIENTKYFFTLFKRHYGYSPQQVRTKE